MIGGIAGTIGRLLLGCLCFGSIGLLMEGVLVVSRITIIRGL